MNILAFTFNRSEYGILKPLLEDLNSNKLFKLSLCIGGAHLNNKFGMTKNEIISDNIEINYTINALASSNEEIFSDILINSKKIIKKASPQAIVLLGDRYETLAVSITSAMMGIPIIHLHGGEITLGSMDNKHRDCISILSEIHFTATEKSAKRLKKIGLKKNVFNVGSLSIENIQKFNFLSFEKFLEKIDFDVRKLFFIVTFHSETLKDDFGINDFQELLASVKEFKEYDFIFTSPNPDYGGLEIIKSIKKFIKDNPKNNFYVPSFGRNLFLSAAKLSCGVIGNSSSGIIEIPSLNICTINIGKRQDGREKAISVIDCEPKKDAIIKSIRKSVSKEFIHKISADKSSNPYSKSNTFTNIIRYITERFID